MATRWWLAEPAALPYAERVHALQSAWSAAPSGLVRWALDAGAWGQAAVEALGRLPDDARWRLVVALLVAPLALFGQFALSLTGLWPPLAELRRTLGQRLTADPHPPPLGAQRAALWAMVGAIAVVMLFQLLGAADQTMRRRPSPFAVAALPDCERIGGTLYRVDTTRLLESLTAEVDAGLGPRRAAVCARLDELEQRAGPGVDAYLDWYFSLGAEWSRLATLLTGDIDLLLRARFDQLVLSSPDLLRLLDGLQSDVAQRWTELAGARGRVAELLERNRLVVGDRGCRVVDQRPHDIWTAGLAGQQVRLAAGSGAGLVAGAVAAKISAKAMGKATLKSAAKLLAKATAKKGLGKAAGAAAGAAIGTVLAPGLGTAVGAAIGAGVGLAVGAGIDLAVLAAEEKFSRAGMRADLMAAVAEVLAPYRDSFGCR